MPSSSYGMTGAEIVSRVAGFFGNSGSDFQLFVEQTLPLAEFRFCKLHPWKFLSKQNLSLTVTSGTEEYTLDTSTIGHYMAADDIESIYNQVEGIYLKKTTLQHLRRSDVKKDDGTATTNITHWAPSGDNKIVVYPSNAFEDTALIVEGKVSPTTLYDLTNYPTIPARLQESFIEYVIAMVADRENDPRAPQLMQKAVGLIKQDIQSDQDGTNGGDEPRIKHWAEASADGIGGDLEPYWIASLFRD